MLFLDSQFSRQRNDRFNNHLPFWQNKGNTFSKQCQRYKCFILTPIVIEHPLQ